MVYDERIPNLIHRYLDDIATEEERAELERWLIENPEAARLFAQMTRLESLIEDTVLEANRQMHITSLTGARSIQSVSSRPNQSWFFRWGWAASVAALMLLSILVYAYTKFSASGRNMQALHLTATVAPNSEIHLKWTDVYDDEDGFQIERSFDGMTYTEVVRVAAGVETYRDTVLRPVTLGYYRVRAFGRSGYSNYSNTASVGFSTHSAISISARGYIGKGSQTLVAGIVISGTESKRILIRTLGPNLRSYGIADVLDNPTVNLRSQGKIIARNDDWRTYDPLGERSGYPCGRTEDIEATGLAPSGENNHLESALLITLPPGLYTADVHGVDDAAGTVLVEIIEVR